MRGKWGHKLFTRRKFKSLEFYVLLRGVKPPKLIYSWKISIVYRENLGFRIVKNCVTPSHCWWKCWILKKLRQTTPLHFRKPFWFSAFVKNWKWEVQKNVLKEWSFPLYSNYLSHLLDTCTFLSIITSFRKRVCELSYRKSKRIINCDTINKWNLLTTCHCHLLTNKN